LIDSIDLIISINSIIFAPIELIKIIKSIMLIFTNQQLESTLPYSALVQQLHAAFCENITVPLRHHHQYDNPTEGVDSTLLLMPAWKSGEYLGVKIITVSPNNAKHKLPSIHGVYLLFNAHTGVPIAQMDAKILTSRRTAAASALASSFLSRKDSRTLLMVGTGALAPCLIEAHATVRPIEKVLVWGRNFAKAQQVVSTLNLPNLDIQPIEKIEMGIAEADIISCATLSEQPLVFGKYLKVGQHLDLVGSFKPNMREVDNVTIQKATVFVDTLEGATKESGDILSPLQSGILKIEDIQADLFGICQQDIFCRKNDAEITLFKSVGHALEDLAAARMVFENR
jgi:ornithine cyclodeaminase/alanine dehydrogenase-like protein (mu-crystallin family)